jgi:hypothetical protein
MADLFHWWDQDLEAGPTGDLFTVEGTSLGQQRVLRRLLTSPGSYIWHPEYGAGLPAYIGSTADVSSIEALIRAQMFLEASVAQDPAPVVTASEIPSGVFVQIQYVDADTGKQVSLSFDVDK